MTERKPIGVGFESWVEQQITEATERGDFDGLPGAGKALPAGDDDEDWWVRSYARRQEVPSDVSLPAPLLLRRQADEIDDQVRGLDTESQVRAAAEDLNRRVRDSWRRPAEHRLVARLVDVEAVLQRWRENRPLPEPVASPAEVRRRTRWWDRLLG
ncbi:MAG TPA: DnaJ family domain-containing protein [Actinoplanes sp.]|nr:DnaJ family domain-containing protein [Actinoplanes sp.]